MKKFKEIDSKYLKNRADLSNKLGKQDLWEVVDQFSLFCGTQTLAKALSVFIILDKTIGVPGDIIEFGCWKGANLMLLAKILKLLEPFSLKEVYGFDSFEGLTTFSEVDEVNENDHINSYKGNEKILRQVIELYEMKPWVNLVKGNALETIDVFRKKNPHVMISLSYIDFDLYEPCVKALEFTHERLSIGGLIAFDEALTHEWKGESVAMREFLSIHKNCYKPFNIGFTRQPTIILEKIKDY